MTLTDLRCLCPPCSDKTHRSPTAEPVPKTLGSGQGAELDEAFLFWKPPHPLTGLADNSGWRGDFLGPVGSWLKLRLSMNPSHFRALQCLGEWRMLCACQGVHSQLSLAREVGSGYKHYGILEARPG